LRDVEKVGEVFASGLPAVVVGHQQSEIPGMINVVTDSETVGRMGAEHLLNCGFKHFAFCGFAKTPVETTAWSEIRRQYFSGRIRAAGFDDPKQYMISGVADDSAVERRRLMDWLVSLPKPVGLMACNDDCGQRVMEGCRLAGLTIPDMVGVIGADNDEVICGLTDPALSSIGINFERAGYDAAQALDQLMRGSAGAPERIMAVASNVVARRSTDFVAAEEPQLTKALQFIRDHARDGLSVDEVARSSGLSRRALEKRFRNFLDRTVLDEIRRVRTDQIARLLIETQLPVGKIADSMGFGDVQHFARYFRSGKRMSPRAYRQAYSYNARAA
jgi:LacI family transcriptional regulator